MADVQEPLNAEKLDATSAAKDPLNRILRDAIREALEVHKKMGNPIAVWRDGQVVIVPPEEIDTGQQE